jgi:hypothetical protein
VQVVQTRSAVRTGQSITLFFLGHSQLRLEHNTAPRVEVEFAVIVHTRNLTYVERLFCADPRRGPGRGLAVQARRLNRIRWRREPRDIQFRMVHELAVDIHLDLLAQDPDWPLSATAA